MSTTTQTTDPYVFEGGFPTPETVQRAYDDADLNRAVQAYRFFFPTVSGLAIFKGNQAVGVIPNRVFARFATEPEQVGFTLNSDTPYGPILLDLRDGPMVIEVPPGPLICVAFDLNQRWVADMGVPGPDAGNGGKHLLLPPDWDGEVPDGYFVARSTTYRVIGGVRSLPVGGDVQAANDRILDPQGASAGPAEPTGPSRPGWTSAASPRTPPRWAGRPTWSTGGRCTRWSTPSRHLDTTGRCMGSWPRLGIAKGRPFAPDERMTRILEQAARIGQRASCGSSPSPTAAPTASSGPDRQWAVGGPAVRERRLLRRRPPRRRRSREVVLPGDRRLTGHVPPRRRRRVAVLAGAARRRRRLSGRRPDLPAGRAAAGPGQAVLVDHGL